MKKVLKYLSWIPFAISIGALVLYLRYFIMFKLDSNLVMTEKVEETLNNYLILVFVFLFIGLLIILFKKIFNLINTKDNSIKEITKKDKEDNDVINNVNNQDFINAIENNSRTLLNINEESNFMKYVKSNKVIKVKLSEAISSQTIKGKVVDTDEEIEILLLDDDLEYFNNKNEIIDSVKCPKCNNVINKDAFICTNCGILLNKEVLNDIVLDFNKEKQVNTNNYVDTNTNIEIKPKKFNFAVFAVNFLIIILCIFLIFLVGNKIINQRQQNYSNMNVVTRG